MGVVGIGLKTRNIHLGKRPDGKFFHGKFQFDVIGCIDESVTVLEGVVR